MTLASLPTLSMQIAFNPTNIQSLTQTWTDVTPYVRDLQTKLGRQHFLDRVEAGTMHMTVSNRNGFFLNGSVNGSGYVVQPRLPIKVTATWSGTTYPVFFGLIDTIEEKITDQLNVDLTITATDLIKLLSLRYMASTNFWNQYAYSSSAVDWYRFTAPTSVVCTSAVSTGSSVTYQAINNFQNGDLVFITGFSGSGIGNTTTNPVAVTGTPTSSQFTVGLSQAAGNSVGTGSAYSAKLVNSINPSNSGYAGYGVVTFPPNGAMVYSNDGCLDIANGQNVYSGAAVFNGYSSNQGAIDFWVLGQGLAGTTLFTVNAGGGATVLNVSVSASGYLQVQNAGTNAVLSTSSNPINDGYWHHVGLINNTSNVLSLYCDGVVGSGITGLTGFNTFTGTVTADLVIGGKNGALLGSSGVTLSAPCLIDELVVSTNNYATLTTEVLNRYTAGTLLTKGFPVTANNVLSGDRIAEILCIAGFGSISGGQIVLNSNTYFINNGSAWVNGTSTNGFVPVQPYYWDSPVTGSTALDLILQICDTDIGSFFQKPDGTFNYFNQNYYGTWSWPLNATSGTWYPNSYTPASDHVWTDDTSSTYHYFGPSLQVLRDDVDVWTTVKVSPQSGTEQIYENVSNEPRYGYSTLTKSGTLHTTLNLALSTANFLGNLFKTPLPRVGNVELRSETNNGQNMTALLNTEFGDVVTFKRNSPNSSASGHYPDQQGLISTNMVVESISHDFQADPGTWHTSFILDPYPIRS